MDSKEKIANSPLRVFTLHFPILNEIKLMVRQTRTNNSHTNAIF